MGKKRKPRSRGGSSGQGGGQGGGGGSYALGTDLSDQFLSIIENDAAIILRVWNKQIIREFVSIG